MTAALHYIFNFVRFHINFYSNKTNEHTKLIIERFCRTILNWWKLCTILDLARYTLVKHNNNREQCQVLCTIFISSIVRQNLSNVHNAAFDMWERKGRLCVTGIMLQTVYAVTFERCKVCSHITLLSMYQRIMYTWHLTIRI